MDDTIDYDAADRILDRIGAETDATDGVGCAATALDSLVGVVSATTTESDGRPAVVATIDPTTAALNDVRTTAVVEHELALVDERTTDDGDLRRVYAERPIEDSRAWFRATEELIGLAAEHTPAEVLDYWIVERGAPDDRSRSQSAWARHRGSSNQRVSQNVNAVARGAEADDDG